MRIKNVLVSVMGIWLCLIADVQAAKQVEKIDVGAQNVELTGLMKQRLLQCQSTYSGELALLNDEIDFEVLKARSANQYANLSIARMEAQENLLKKKRETGFDYKKCVDSAKSDVNSTLKSYVAMFKQNSLKSMAKQVVSQWFVAIDAVGEKHFKEEVSKFDKATNDMKVELAMM